MSKWLHKPLKQNKSTKSQAASKIKNLDRYRNFLKIRKIFSLILTGCIIIALIVVLATAFFTGKFTEFFYHTKQLSAEDRFPVTLKEQSFINASGLDRYLSMLTKNGVVFLDQKGHKAEEGILGFSSPILRSNRTGVMVYDQGGTQFQYLQPFQPGYTIETNKKIITGAISENGLCAIASYHDRYAAEVTVYNTNSSISYHWYSASDKVTSLAFSSGRLYVGCINSENGFLQTIVYTLDINSEKEIYHVTLSDSVAPVYLHPMSNGRLAVVTTGSVEFLDSKGVLTNASFYYSNLYAISGNDKYLGIAQQNIYNNTTNLVVYNPDGDRLASREIIDQPIDLEMHGAELYCLTDQETIRWNFVKDSISFVSLQENYSGMVIFDNTVFLFNNNTIDRAEHAAQKSKNAEK